MAHPGLGGLIIIVGIVMIADTRIIIWDCQDAMGRPGPSQPDVPRPGGTRAGNRHARLPHRAIPALSPGTVLIWRPIRDQHVSRRGRWNPGPLNSQPGLRLISDLCPLSHPGLRLITDPCPLNIIPDSMIEIWRTIRDLHMCLGKR